MPKLNNQELSDAYQNYKEEKKILYGPTLITGDTGSGKTYHAINNYPGSFAYVAPCKQLVYETYQDYGDSSTQLRTGDIHIDGSDNFMGTYEALDPQEIEKYDRLIIDESHYLDDYERGGHILSLIKSAKEQMKKVLLLTATQNFSDELLDGMHINKLHLLPWKSVPEKKQVDYNTFKNNVNQGHSSIIFVKYTPHSDEICNYANRFGLSENQVAILSASNTSLERIIVQNKFRNGEIKLLICTNVLAQGVNFPTTNILIEYNERDGREIIEQKIGRLGRPTFCDNINEVYYCLDYRPKPQKKDILEHAVINASNICDVAQKPLSKYYMPHMLFQSDMLYGDYKSWKYCYPSIKEMIVTDNILPEHKSTIQEIYEFFLEDRKNLKDRLLNFQRSKSQKNNKF